MAAIEVERESSKTTIRRRQNGWTWLFCLPYLFLFCFVLAVPIAAVYRLAADSAAHHPLRAWIVAAGIIFGFKAWWFGRFLYRTLGARSILVVQGATLHVMRGTVGHVEDFGTYAASALADLSLISGKNIVLPRGRVVVQISDVPLILADRISDADGSYLIDALCAAYPFSTPSVAPSPAVVQW